MILDNANINVDIKVQDRYRKWLSNLMSTGTMELKCVMLGDSDIDYELSPNMINARILNSPYNIESIKYPLIYNGIGNGISGAITSFVRYVDENGNVLSYYNYPLTNDLTIGRVPPTLKNGLDTDVINFTSNKMGIIIFLQTLLDYYRDENGVQERLNEQFDITVLFNGSQNIPTGWQIINDFENGSFLISKNAVALTDPTTTFNGVINVKGRISNIQKTISFNL